MSMVRSPAVIADSLVERWSPRAVAEVDDGCEKVAKVHGTLAGRAHDAEDELFYVLNGTLRIEMDDNAVVSIEGDVFVVPKGVRHDPIADDVCHVRPIERKSTQHTGAERMERKRSFEEQLRPV